MKKQTDEPTDATAAFKSASARADTEVYVLRLYVTGSTPNSLKAIKNLRRLCETHLAGRYELEIIDLYQQPERALEEQITAIPTLVKQLPPPLRRSIGNLSRTQEILLQLDLKTSAEPPGKQ